MISSNKHTHTFTKAPLAIVCALLPLLSSPAWTKTESSAVEEVIVTASKRAQPLQDFAGAASVISNFQGVKNIGDIATLVPGLNIIDAGPRNPTGLIIRGLRMNEMDPRDLGGDGSLVASYVDNIPLQGHFVPPSFSLKDLQQVEVLRGPQGMLYGNASVGGLIRYVTAKPDLTKQSVTVNAEVSQTKHSDDLSYDTDVVVNTPLIDNTLALRVLLGKTDNAGFIDNPYLLSGAQEDINDDQTKQARVSLLWQASDDFSLNTSYHYQQLNVGDRQAANESFTGDKYTVASRYLQPMEGELQLTSIDADYKLGFATLTASLSHYDYSHNERADQTDYYLVLDDVYYGNSYYSAVGNVSAYNASSVDVVKDSVELRLVSDNEQRLRWLVGGFYSRDDVEAYIADYVPGLNDTYDAGLPSDAEYLATQTQVLDEYSVYGELAYDLTRQWEVTLGARYFRYDDKLAVTTAFPFDNYFNLERGDDESSGSLGKFSTRYKFTEEHSIYFSVAEGYRRGGANLTPPGVTTNVFYEPDEATSYELGMHSDWFNKRVQLNAALFSVQWKNIQVRTSADGRNFIDNAAKARSQGVELDLTAQLNEMFVLRGSYSYTDAALTETVEDIFAYDGDRLPGSPRNHFSIALDYAQLINGKELDASLSFSRIGDVYTALNTDFYNYQKLDAYNTANARIGVTLSNWRLGAFVTNIENTRGITGARSNEWHGEQGKFEYITRPRTVGMSVTYRY
jgi:iron complex outermembrane receptor protein